MTNERKRKREDDDAPERKRKRKVQRHDPVEVWVRDGRMRKTFKDSADAHREKRIFEALASVGALPPWQRPPEMYERHGCCVLELDAWEPMPLPCLEKLQSAQAHQVLVILAVTAAVGDVDLGVTANGRVVPCTFHVRLGTTPSLHLGRLTKFLPQLRAVYQPRRLEGVLRQLADELFPWFQMPDAL